MVIIEAKYEWLDKLGDDHRPYLVFFYWNIDDNSKLILHTIEEFDESYPDVACLKVDYIRDRVIIRECGMDLHIVIVIECGKGYLVHELTEQQELIYILEELKTRTEKYYTKQSNLANKWNKKEFQCTSSACVNHRTNLNMAEDNKSLNMPILQANRSGSGENLNPNSSSSSFINRTRRDSIYVKCRTSFNGIFRNSMHNNKSQIPNEGNPSNADMMMAQSSNLNRTRSSASNYMGRVEEVRLRAMVLTDRVSPVKNCFPQIRRFICHKSKKNKKKKFITMSS